MATGFAASSAATGRHSGSHGHAYDEWSRRNAADAANADNGNAGADWTESANESTTAASADAEDDAGSRVDESLMVVVDQDGSIGRWLCARTGGEWSPQSVSFGNVLNGRLIGAVMFDLFNGSSIAMHCAGDRGWLTREFLKRTFSYAFDFAKVKKIIGLVDSSNEKARKLDEHLGFKLEGTIKDAAPKGDLLIYSMTRPECRFIGKPGG